MPACLQKYGLIYRLPVLLALLTTHKPASSLSFQDTVPAGRQIPPAFHYFQGNVSVGPYGMWYSPSVLAGKALPANPAYPHYLDSLKSKASRNLITRKLFDIVVVKSGVNASIRNTGESDAAYREFEGMKIRQVTLKRLPVFGGNIREPDNEETDRLERILNRTHVNTLETIIRKNLLFRSGDIISPLLLSDNERLLRQLSYIDDARIVVIPVSAGEADILVLTKDIYSLAASYNYGGLKKGSLEVFDKNIFGMGHEFGIEIPFDSRLSNLPGFGTHYTVTNIGRTFINLNTFFLDDLKKKSYGVRISRDLLTSSTKYAGGISIIQTQTTEDLGSLPVPQLLRYNYQDYWMSRSFLIDRQSVSRIIIGARFIHNNVFNRPSISPESYHELQNYLMYLGSAAFSVQKYYKASLIYGYGRTEDIPYGGMVRFTAGNEINEFKHRYYLGTEMSLAKHAGNLGYFYSSLALSAYLNEGQTEQGMIAARINHFSELFALGRNMMRVFVNFRYTKGFNRYSDEHLFYPTDNGFSGFRNDSVTGIDRFSLDVESVLFSPINFYGFRFAFFGFADYSFLAGAHNSPYAWNNLTSVGLGIRVRNDNLLFNTFQVRIAWFPDPPAYSRISNIVFSGEQLLRPSDFNPGPPSVIYYR